MLKASDLPLRYCGYSHCFRREAGTNGTKDKGLYRVHQFTKVCIRIIMSIFRLKCIMFVCRLKAKRCSMSLLLFKKRFAMIWNCMFVFLKCLLVFVHYNAFFIIMNIEELGNSAYRKIDFEAYMPGRQGYGEICSISNCTDYQSRRLNIRTKVLFFYLFHL